MTKHLMFPGWELEKKDKDGYIRDEKIRLLVNGVLVGYYDKYASEGNKITSISENPEAHKRIDHFISAIETAEQEERERRNREHALAASEAKRAAIEAAERALGLLD